MNIYNNNDWLTTIINHYTYNIRTALIYHSSYIAQPIPSHYYCDRAMDSILRFGDQVRITFTFPVQLTPSLPLHPVFFIPRLSYMYVDYSSEIQQISPNTIAFKAVTLWTDSLMYVGVLDPMVLVGAATGKPIHYLDQQEGISMFYRFITRPGK